MKTAIAIVLVALVAVTVISGCVHDTGISGELTEEQMEDQAYQAVEQELDSMEDMDLEDLEQELLQ